MKVVHQREIARKWEVRRTVSEQWKIPGPTITKKNQVFKIFKELHTDKEKQTTQKKKKTRQKTEPAHHRKFRPRGAEARERGVPSLEGVWVPLKILRHLSTFQSLQQRQQSLMGVSGGTG